MAKTKTNFLAAIIKDNECSIEAVLELVPDLQPKSKDLLNCTPACRPSPTPTRTRSPSPGRSSGATTGSSRGTSAARPSRSSGACCRPSRRGRTSRWCCRPMSSNQVCTFLPAVAGLHIAISRFLIFFRENVKTSDSMTQSV